MKNDNTISARILDKLSHIWNTLDDCANESRTISRPLFRTVNVFVTLVYRSLAVLLRDPHHFFAAKYCGITPWELSRICICETFKDIFRDIAYIANPV